MRDGGELAEALRRIFARRSNGDAPEPRAPAHAADQKPPDGLVMAVYWHRITRLGMMLKRR